MAVKIQVEVLWVVMLCSVVVGYQSFRDPHCLHLHPIITLCSVATQKRSMWIFRFIITREICHFSRFHF